MKRAQTCVLGCEASLGGEVDDQQGLVPELGEGDGLTVDTGHSQCINIHEIHSRRKYRANTTGFRHQGN